MNNNAAEMNGILKQDLTDFIVFFLFGKYLTAFNSEHIPLIANAIATSWKKRIESGAAVLNQTGTAELMRELMGSDFQYKDVKRESDRVMQEEMAKLCNLIRNIGEDAAYERTLIEQSIKPPTKIPKKPTDETN